MTRLDSAFFVRPLAHRGYHDLTRRCPENSRASFAAAIAAGYGIECDLQLSTDGRALVFHDYDLSRLTDEVGLVRDRTASDLSKVILKGGDEGIPTLSEVLQLVAGRTPLLIELKDQDGALGSDVGSLEEAVARDLAYYDGAAAIMSFNPHSTEVLADLLPDMPRGLVTCDFMDEEWEPASLERRAALNEIPDFERLSCDFISHDRADLDRPRVAEIKAKGGAVFCWTVRSPEQEAEARSIVHNITFEGYAASLTT